MCVLMEKMRSLYAKEMLVGSILRNGGKVCVWAGFWAWAHPKTWVRIRYTTNHAPPTNINGPKKQTYIPYHPYPHSNVK